MLRTIANTVLLGCLWLAAVTTPVSAQEAQLEESAVLRGTIEQVDPLSRTLKIEQTNFRVSETTRIHWRNPDRPATFGELTPGTRIRYLIATEETAESESEPKLERITITSKP